MNSKTTNLEKKQILYALVIPTILIIVLILSFLLEKGMNWDFHHGGIYPRQAKGILGILTSGFIHSNWTHLFNNCLSLFVLSCFVCYFYSDLEVQILLYSYIGSGILLWSLGRPNWHIGASGLVYALCFFLFFSGIFRKHIPLVAVSLIVVFLYGSVVWHMLPWQIADPVSWEGHLSGGIVGTDLAVIDRHKGPQKPQPMEDNEETETDTYWNEEQTDFETNNNTSNIEINKHI